MLTSPTPASLVADPPTPLPLFLPPSLSLAASIKEERNFAFIEYKAAAGASAAVAATVVLGGSTLSVEPRLTKSYPAGKGTGKGTGKGAGGKGKGGERGKGKGKAASE